MYYWSDEFVGPDDYDDIVDGCYTLSAEKANATVKNVFGVSIPDYKADYIDETSDFTAVTAFIASPSVIFGFTLIL